MKKKLTKHGNSFALIIDKPLLKMLNITERTALNIYLENGKLIVEPVAKRTKKSEEDLDKIAKRIMEKYESVFKKLSKS